MGNPKLRNSKLARFLAKLIKVKPTKIRAAAACARPLASSATRNPLQLLTLIAGISVTAANSQTVDFNNCQLSPVFQALSGNSTLFRDPSLTNDNGCTQVPGDYEHYVDASNPPSFYQSRANFDPGSEFAISFNYRPYLNNNSHFQLVINTNSENVGTYNVYRANPQFGLLPDGALRIRIGNSSRVGFDGLAWEVVGANAAGGAHLNYEALVDNINPDPFTPQASEMNLNISVTGGQVLTVQKQILEGSVTDPAPVTVLNNVDIGPGMSTTPGNFITFTTLESAAQIDDFTFNNNPPSPFPQTFRLKRVASGFDQPLYVTQAPGEPNSLYVVEELTNNFSGPENRGQIIKLDLVTGNRTSFLTIDNVVPNIEGGLHGLAFHPDFQTNGKLYITWLKSPEPGQNQRRLRLDEYIVSDDSPALNRTLVDQANLSPSPSHSINWIGFKPGATGAEKDYLYITTGDGGIQAEEAGFTNVSQDLSKIQGKVLRIDLQVPDAYPSDPERNYGIPVTNPFVDDGDPNTLGEVLHSGLRNPWRASFDRQTGDMFLGDVGNGTFEEVHFVKNGEVGLDFGWANREGTIENPAPAVGGSLGDSLNPIQEFSHSSGFYSIAGGYVYRGPVDELNGLYFVAESVTGQLFTGQFERDTDPATFNGTNMTQLLERRAEFESLIPGGGSIDLPVSFGEDLDGNLYIVDFGSGGLGNPGFNTGEIFVVVPFVPGDYNLNGFVDAGDYTVWQDNLGNTGSPGLPGDGDNGSGTGRPDGIVSQADYEFWKTRFGTTFASVSAGAMVPEPATWLLLSTGLFGLNRVCGLNRNRADRKTMAVRYPLQ